MGAPAIDSFGHIDLTVTDGERSMKWWTEVMGYKLVATMGRPGFVVWSMYHPCGIPVGLVVHDEGVESDFDERVAGLDHFAFRVRDREALEAWVTHLDDLGVAHSGVQEENGGPLVTVRDPDNIQVELWAFDPALVVLGQPTERDLFLNVEGDVTD